MCLGHGDADWGSSWLYKPGAAPRRTLTRPPGVGTSMTTAQSIAGRATLCASLCQAKSAISSNSRRSALKHGLLSASALRGFQGAADVYDRNEKRIAQVHEGVSLLSGIHPQTQPITLAFESRPGELYYLMVTVLEANTRGDYELTVRKE